MELRNLARGRLDRHAQVERMCQLTAHRCCFVARRRASHSLTANDRASLVTAFISTREGIMIKHRRITESTYRSTKDINYITTQMLTGGGTGNVAVVKQSKYNNTILS